MSIWWISTVQRPSRGFCANETILCASARLRGDVEFELEQLSHLLEVHRELVLKSQDCVPSSVELSALAMMLHSFYTGVENIFKRITVDSGDQILSGENWHRALLDSMLRSASSRPIVISPETHESLGDYRAFRHVFRNAYSFDLDWGKLAPLVADCDSTLKRLNAELRLFLENETDPKGDGRGDQPVA